MPYVEPPDWTTFKKLGRDKYFAAHIRRAIEIKKQIAELEREQAELNDELEPAMMAGGLKDNESIRFEGATVTVRDKATGSHVDATLLVQAGVSRKVIDKCIVQHKRSHFVEITLPKAKADKDKKGTAK